MKTKLSDKTKKVIIKSAITLFGIALLLLLIYFVFRKLGWHRFTQEQLQEKIHSFGPWGPLLFIILSFAQVTILPLPGAITILAGNYVFGFFLAFLYSFIGSLLGSLVSFFLGRKIGKKFVYWIAGDKEVVDTYLINLKGKENVILFFMFLLPFFPDDLLCALAGITPISYRGFFFMQLVTRTTSILATLLFMSGDFIPYHGWGLVVLIMIGIGALILFLISYKHAAQINERFYTILNHLFFKKKKK